MMKEIVLPYRLCILFTAAISITACAPYQSVQGSYSTPNKRVEGMVLGATAATIVTSAPSGLGTVAAAGAGGGLLLTHARTSLMKTLSQQGVNVIAQGDTLRLVLHSDKFFYNGTPALRPKNYPILDNVAALLKEYGKVPITIAGYTDSIGSPNDQYTLTQQQAESMRAYLWTHGIEHEHLKVVGYGSRDPVAANSGTGYAANRRIEITLKSF
jgi:outer membrane protein OmpA-like peptidoglycan-associated protein